MDRHAHLVEEVFKVRVPSPDPVRHGSQTNYNKELRVEVAGARAGAGGGGGSEGKGSVDRPHDLEARHLDGHAGDAVIHETLRHGVGERPCECDGDGNGEKEIRITI